MSTLQNQYNLLSTPQFTQRVKAALVNLCVSVANEIQNEIQQVALTGTPTGGSFTLTMFGQTTTAIQWNSIAGTVGAAVNTALASFTQIGPNTTIASGGPLPGTPVNITYIGNLSGQALNLLTATSSLTGTNPGITISRVQAGVSVVNHAARAALALQILQNPDYWTTLFAVAVAGNATVLADWASGPAEDDAAIITAVTNVFNAYHS